MNYYKILRMNMKNSKPCAEIIESSLLGWLAQSWQWDYFPDFGSIVTIETKKRTIIGLVHQIQTGSMDPIRYPFPYQKTEEELLKEQPQIFEFLKTTFSCVTIGYQEKGRMYYQLAPEPPKIHSFVVTASQDLTKIFFADNRYLHVLFGLTQHVAQVDELLLALLKQLSDATLLSEQKLEDFIQTFSLLTGNDYRRLKLFLQRAQTIINL